MANYCFPCAYWCFPKGGIISLFSSWEEMIQYRRPPVLLTVTLLPWKDVIISDGLVSITNINFGKTYSSDFKEIYLNAKCNRNIIKSL